MEPSLYQDILAFKQHAIMPLTFPSSKSNWVAMCQKFDVNGASQLTRNSKIVLKTTDLERIIEFPSKIF